MALRTLQPSASDKNILVGLSKTGQKENAKINPKDDKLAKRKGLEKENDYGDSTSKLSKKTKRKQQSVIQMLVNPKVSESYLKDLAEERRIALEVALKENESLHEQMEVSETENALLKERKEENEQLLQLIAKESNPNQNSSASDRNILVGLSKTGQKENAKINPEDDKSAKRKGLENEKENDYGDSTSKPVSKKTKRKQQNVTQMLVNPKVSESYLRDLAEERRIALEATLKENESLQERLEVVETENALLKEINEQTEQLFQLITKESNLDQNSEEETAE